ncbi:hypothetical protein [Phyllobacterium sp. SB3]|uniref:hypothetical protein n=1 Tax=Phyllobacterium sp. SB3 TaxID=3156073 RepID=UPI0032AF8A3B
MSSYFYLLWAIAQQQITSGQKRRMPEDEFYEKYGRSPGRILSRLKRFFKLVRSSFLSGKNT